MQALQNRQKPIRIVVLDDESILVELISAALQTFFERATILKFTDPLQGLEELRQTDPDLLTLDWNMPKLTGAGVLNFLLQKGVKYPILLITASGEQVTAQVKKYKAQGLNLSLVDKPFTRDDLWSRISRLCDDRADSMAA